MGRIGILLGMVLGMVWGVFAQTITVIQGSDTVSSSRGVINTNFAELNTWKAKVGACSSGQVAVAATVSGVTCVTVAALCPTCVLGPGVSVDSEVALWNGTSGALLKRASATGVATLTSGVLGVVSGSGSNCVLVNGTSQACSSGSGTVTSVDVTSSDLTVGGAPITTSGTITLALNTVGVTKGGTGRTTLTNHGVLVGAGVSAITQLGAGALDTVLQGGGAAADPSFVSLANCANDGGHALVYSTSTHLWACATITATGTGDPAGYTTTTFSATPTFTVTKNTGQTFQITLTGNVTSSTMDTSGITNSGRPIVTFRIIQDSTPRTFVWPGNVLNAGTIDTTSGSVNVQTFVWDGTNFQALGTMFVTNATGGSIVLPGSSSGTLTIKPAAAAGTGSVLTLPGGTTDFSSTGGTSQFVKQVSAGAALTVVRPSCADLSDSGAGCSGSGGGGSLGSGAIWDPFVGLGQITHEWDSTFGQIVCARASFGSNMTVNRAQFRINAASGFANAISFALYDIAGTTLLGYSDPITEPVGATAEAATMHAAVSLTPGTYWSCISISGTSGGNSGAAHATSFGPFDSGGIWLGTVDPADTSRLGIITAGNSVSWAAAVATWPATLGALTAPASRADDWWFVRWAN